MALCFIRAFKPFRDRLVFLSYFGIMLICGSFHLGRIFREWILPVSATKMSSDNSRYRMKRRIE